MPSFATPINTYGDTTLVKRVITNAISLIDPIDTPLIDALGGFDGAAGKFSFSDAPGKQVEWSEDTYLPITGSTNGSVASNGTTVTVGSADINNLQKGMILLIGSEHLYVSSDPDRANFTMTVSRAFAGSTAASINTVTAFKVIGVARVEGEDSTGIGYSDKVTASNYSQIWHQEVKATRSSYMTPLYGIANQLAYEADKVVPQLSRLMELHLLLNGASSAGSASTPRVMGGLGAFITTNLSDGSSLTQAKFENAVKAAYLYGGTGPYIAVCSPTNMQKIKNFYESSSFLRIDRLESTVGMVITSIRTPYGDVSLMLNRWAVDTKIWILDQKHMGLLTLYPFTQEPLAKTGDADKVQVVGEFTFCLRQEKAHAVLTNVS